MFTSFRQQLRKRRIQPRIELTLDGFVTVGADDERFLISWANVTKVAAYKRDLLTTDEILLAFEVTDRPGMVQEVSEEWPGFTDLFKPMEQHLAISPAWYPEVMKPAFAANLRVLYDRSNLAALDSSGEAAG